jgi:hypothetical protein
MRVTLLGFGLAGMLMAGAGVNAQEMPAPPRQVHAEDGGVSERLESLILPPKANAPFVSTLQTEWVRTMADGGSITLVNERRIVRDGKGRIYQERWWLVPKNGKIKSAMETIQISDPEKHTIYACFTQRKVCELQTYTRSPNTMVNFNGPSTGPIANDTGFAIHENLGKRLVAGVETQGVRETMIYNPGVFGNDKKYTVSREFWYSPELGINLLSKRDDPRFGTQTFTIANLSLAEPDTSLFELPQGFEIVDLRPPTQAPADPK